MTTTKRTIFTKEHARGSSNLELFRVSRIKLPQSGESQHASYIFIRDLTGEEVRGAFRQDQLIHALSNPNDNDFSPTIINYTRQKNGTYSVKFAGE